MTAPLIRSIVASLTAQLSPDVILVRDHLDDGDGGTGYACVKIREDYFTCSPPSNAFRDMEGGHPCWHFHFNLKSAGEFQTFVRHIKPYLLMPLQAELFALKLEGVI